MKNLRLTATLLVLFSSLLFVNCTPEQVESYSTTKEVISQGTWSVNYYFDGQDRTPSFHDFQFDFKSDGTLTVAYGTSIQTGTWISQKDADGEVLTFKLDS